MEAVLLMCTFGSHFDLDQEVMVKPKKRGWDGTEYKGMEG